MIVCKFGGSSVADSSQIAKVKAILLSDPDRHIAVVSAPGKRNKEDQKITDALYACNTLVQQNKSCKPVFENIETRFLEIASALKVNKKKVQAELDEIRRNIDAGRGADYTASRGEYLSAFVISRYLGWQFIDAAEAVVINADATVNDESYDRLARLIDPSKRYVIPGFYGATIDGVVKTFTRGGSDISGAIVSRAVGATMYENWTDVSGMYSADPRLIPEAQVIPELTYKQVRELSDVGASVFHPEAIAPVIARQIPINIKNTNNPDDKGTMIIPSSDSRKLIGVSGKSGYSRIRVSKLMLFKKYGMRHALLTMLHIFGIRPEFSLFGIDSIVWLFDSSQASDSVCEAMCARLKKEFSLDSIEVDRGHAVIGLVGGYREESFAYIDAASALKAAGIHLNFLNYGASDTTTLLGVDDAYLNDAVKCIYRALF